MYSCTSAEVAAPASAAEPGALQMPGSRTLLGGVVAVAHRLVTGVAESSAAAEHTATRARRSRCCVLVQADSKSGHSSVQALPERKPIAAVYTSEFARTCGSVVASGCPLRRSIFQRELLPQSCLAVHAQA